VAGATDGGGAPTGYARARAGEYAASAHKRRPLQQCSKGWQPSALHKQNWQTSHRGACRRTSSLLQRAGGEAVVSLQPGKQTRCVLERHYSFKGVPSKGQVRAFGLRSRQFVQGQIPCTLIQGLSLHELPSAVSNLSATAATYTFIVAESSARAQGSLYSIALAVTAAASLRPACAAVPTVSV